MEAEKKNREGREMRHRKWKNGKMWAESKGAVREKQSQKGWSQLFSSYVLVWCQREKWVWLKGGCRESKRCGFGI